MAHKKKFAPNDNNLAIAYYRFSSHSQNEASIDQQRELAHEWADAHGFKIVQEYEDAAISGTTDARPGFQQMLSEVAKIRPHTLIMWKTDRLGRDKYVLAMAKKKIRDAGCEIHLLAEHIPTEGPEGVLIEGLMEAMAEYYSRQLSQNIQRGMDYNAQHALYNGHKLFGYDVDRSTKKYIPDPNTAPFVQWAFKEYASGRPLKTIAEEMNAQGLRTPRNAKFSVNMLNKMLKNRAYIGEYHHGDITVAGGMPVLVDEATFDRAQRRFAENKRKGSQRAHGMNENEAPRYWLTGKLYCGECGSTMQGVSGTSKTGRTYYYYYCSAQRRKECHLHKARKQDLEDMVLFALHNIVDDEENVTALALDAAEYYEKNHNDTAYLEALEAKRKEVEKSLANLVKVIEKGVVSDTVTERLTQLEEQKSALNDAIETENVRVSLCEDRHSIQAYFDKFLHADVNDPEIRDQVFEYFVDKVYLYDDKLVVSMWFSEDDKQEITWRDWFSLDEYWTDESPFVKGGSVEFDCFPLSSRQVYELFQYFREKIPAFKNAKIVQNGYVGVRESGRVKGKYVLTRQDIISEEKCKDSVAIGAFPMDIHQQGSGMKYERVLRGYGIPACALWSEHIKNLFMGGRCISSTFEANASCRISITCMATGQAAGVMASEYQEGINEEVLIRNSRDILVSQNAII